MGNAAAAAGRSVRMRPCCSISSSWESNLQKKNPLRRENRPRNSFQGLLPGITTASALNPPWGLPMNNDRGAALLQLVGELAAEVHPAQTPKRSVSLDSTLGRELGLDSLARMELIAR